MRAIFDMIMTVAPQTSRVLITGETGTGKELVARAIHENSARSKEPFITINCGAFPETLLESELFGYVKGAFTGANENRQGLFQAAHGGTLFLDEIGNMSLPMQVKLFRVLQEGKVRPVGSNEEYGNGRARDRGDQQGSGQGHRRRRIPRGLVLPPERHPHPLAAACANAEKIFRCWRGPSSSASARSMEKPIEGIAPEAMSLLEAYDWPGNVRELENTMERSVALETRNHDFSRRASRKNSAPRPAGNAVARGALQRPLSIFRRAASTWRNPSRIWKGPTFLAALEASDGVGTRAAEMLKMSYRSFRHYSKKYNTRQA